ncbi:hypothetical protein GL50803_0010764 [Giardia duodenalis]|uniref:Uncharacterized protein n=1 Tax=Giardia intestinalis (strain ATCC 50803 / WB clone C6) TaxID=184922 RepID=D3KHF3_GIAIC|nr:hypothetical protein GL50803_0010764 [Giardia intestinalis]KAE8303905.1 hypothetical protein GL50803_0010764 [Giardia intestinalis]
MDVPLYRPSLDFNSLSVPPNYVPGSLRGDRGFRTSAETIVATPIAFCESELETFKELSRLHAPSRLKPQHAQEEEQMHHVKEPKRKREHRQRPVMMPAVYDLSQTQRFEAIANRDTYRCYTVTYGDSVTSIYSPQEKNYAKEVTDLEIECHRNPTVVSLWLRLISVHYNVGNAKLAARTAVDMFNNMDCLCNHTKLWDLLLSDDSIAMKVLLEQCDLSSIDSVFQLILTGLNACIPADYKAHPKGHLCSLVCCKHMVLCANIFCILFFSSWNEPSCVQLLCSRYNELLASLLQYQSYNTSYFLAVVEILYLRIYGSALYHKDNINLQSYDDLIKYNYEVSEKIILEDSQSNIFLGAYMLAEGIILQNSKHIALVAQHAINGAFRDPTEAAATTTITTLHSKQLERLICGIGSFSLSAVSTGSAGDSFVDKSLLLLQKLMCKEGGIHSLVKDLVSSGVGASTLTSINRVLKDISSRPADERLLLLHMGRRICLSILENLEQEDGKGMNSNELKELLVCIEYIHKENMTVKMGEYLVANGVKVYHQVVARAKLKPLDKLEIGLLLLSMCKSAELAEDLFRIYEKAVKREESKQNRRESHQARLNVFPRIENMILYAEKEHSKEAIVECAGGPGLLYQGAIKEAILVTARHVFPYTEKFIDKLLALAKSSQWLQTRVDLLLQGAKYLVIGAENKSTVEIAICLQKYAKSASDAWAGNVQLNYITETLEVLMLPHPDGIKRLKQCTGDYVQTPWAASLMSLFIYEQDREKAELYWTRWTEALRRGQHSLGSTNSPAKNAFDGILSECSSVTFRQEDHISRGDIILCLLKAISVVLFYSCQVD